MASTLRVFPTPAALRVGGVLGRGFRSAGAPVFHRNCDGFRSVRCSAEDSAVESPAREEKKDVAVHAEPSSSSSLQHLGDSLADQFGGWYGVEEEEKHTWKVGKVVDTEWYCFAVGLCLWFALQVFHSRAFWAIPNCLLQNAIGLLINPSLVFVSEDTESLAKVWMLSACSD